MWVGSCWSAARGQVGVDLQLHLYLAGTLYLHLSMLVSHV